MRKNLEKMGKGVMKFGKKLASRNDAVIGAKGVVKVAKKIVNFKKRK